MTILILKLRKCYKFQLKWKRYYTYLISEIRYILSEKVLANSKNKISLFIKTYYNFPHVKNIYDDIFYFYIFIIFYYNAK